MYKDIRWVVKDFVVTKITGKHFENYDKGQEKVEDILMLSRGRGCTGVGVG